MKLKKMEMEQKMPEPPKVNGKNGLKKKLPVRGVMIQMKFDFQKLLWIGIVILMGLSLLELWSSGQSAATEVQLSQALSDIKDGKVERVDVYAEKLLLKYK